MQSSLIGKIEKAKRYAEEKERVSFVEFRASFRGEHNNYVVSYKEGKWRCSCRFFSSRDMQPYYGYAANSGWYATPKHSFFAFMAKW